MSSSPRWWRFVSYGLLAVNSLVSAAVLVASWAVNAPSLGLHDFGIALSASIAATVALEVSLLLICLSFLVSLGGLVARWRTRVSWLATLVAAIPITYLSLIGM